MPNGKRRTIYKGPNDRMADIVPEVLIAPWKAHCQKLWEHPRVKGFLDRCGYLLLRDGPGDTLTNYKEMARGRTEIAASSCPSYIQDRFHGSAAILREDAAEEGRRFDSILETAGDVSARTKPSANHVESKFDRLERAHREYPQCAFDSCRVDTDNVFCWLGRRYRIDERAKQYAPFPTREGDYFVMDRVIVIHDRGLIRGYLDGEGRALDTALIAEISPKRAEG